MQLQASSIDRDNTNTVSGSTVTHETLYCVGSAFSTVTYTPAIRNTIVCNHNSMGICHAEYRQGCYSIASILIVLSALRLLWCHDPLLFIRARFDHILLWLPIIICLPNLSSFPAWPLFWFLFSIALSLLTISSDSTDARIFFLPSSVTNAWDEFRKVYTCRPGTRTARGMPRISNGVNRRVTGMLSWSGEQDGLASARPVVLG